MTKEETVTVTYEVPLSVAKIYAVEEEEDKTPLMKACEEALAARKTKYDRWKEDHIWGEWDPYCGNHGIVHTDGRMRNIVGQFMEDYYPSDYDIALMAAAPQLLEALIAELGDYDGTIDPEAWNKETYNAIRAALPKDVADEVLGVK